MAWFPVDDAAHSHPKMRRAGLEAVGLWTVSGSFCMAYLTDGFVPEWFVKEKPKGLALAKKLVEAGLWVAGECNGEKGWWFHDWKPECTKERIEEHRANARARKQKSRASQRDKPEMSHVTDTVTGRVTDAERNAGVLGYPNQTNKRTTTHLSRERSVSNARESDGPTDRMGRPAMSVTVIAGNTEPEPLPPPPPDRGITADDRELVKATVPQGHPRATLNRLAEQVAKLRRDGTDPEVIQAALALWCEKPSVGIGQTIMASLVSEVIKSRSAPRHSHNGKPQKLRALAELHAIALAVEQDNAQLSLPPSQSLGSTQELC